MWATQFYPFKHHGQWVTSGGLGTMGFGIPSAIGAQLVNLIKQLFALLVMVVFK